MIYLVVFVLLFVGIIRYDIVGEKDNYSLLKFVFFFLFCLGGLSYLVGQDSYSYLLDFNLYQGSLRLLFTLDRRQPGWVILNYLCRMITDDFVLVKLIQSAMVNFSVFYFIKKQNCPKYTVALFYYLFVFPQFCFNILREGLAISFLLYGFIALKDRKWLLYYLFVFWAFLFHYSAVFSIILPLFVLIKDQNKFFPIALTFILLFSLMTTQSQLTQQINIILAGFEEGDLSKYSLYLNQAGSQQRSYLALVLRLFTMFIPIMYCFYKKGINMNWGFIAASLLYVFCYTLSTKITIFHRISQLFIIPYYYTLAVFIVNAAKIEFKQLKYLFLILAILFYMIPLREYFVDRRDIGRYHKTMDFYYPYTSVFNKEDASDRLFIF